MNRTTLACYSLLASAFVLAAILFVQIQSSSILPQAHAGMVVSNPPINAMTLRARKGEEVLCILENASQRLLIYRTDISRKQLRLMKNIKLSQAFGRTANSGAAGNRTSR